ncbi:SDR family oxidoreductase [Nocardioides nitrophenolicus]|uniref:SDR family oxidoreductase n=1 Tax=Nocardioides nitrophenolicus TaxID=60489 RepID=UPI0019570C47|nr:SDR family oxidoreductase [Nocardioides nitrophenolicus]MBM7519694.1 NAD(P)-dependent dehydrogenase (short-subunit alcohol dehydrogenase family) [Nocardioides nitrophenolicus]
MPTIDGAVVLVTGANGGLGTHFVHQALERGAAKVYAAARSPRDWDDDRIVPLVLDVTSAGSIAAAAETAADVTVLVNNAGAANGASVLGDLAAARELFETNFWGALAVTSAFEPALRASGGTVLNVLSVLSWLGVGDAYSASKAALWQATNTQRLALAPAGVHVAGLHLGYADTPMTKGVDAPKLDPADVVRSAYDGVETGAYEILADDLSARVKAGLAGPVEALYPQLG